MRYNAFQHLSVYMKHSIQVFHREVSLQIIAYSVFEKKLTEIRKENSYIKESHKQNWFFFPEGAREKLYQNGNNIIQ